MSRNEAEHKIALRTLEDAAQLETLVQNRLSGRILELRVLLHGPGLILRGRTRTFYAKQLVQHVVMEVTNLPILANQIEVS
jgi:hypothetical protein